MVQPCKAVVRPRVVSPESGETILLDDVISSLIDRLDRGTIELIGPKGRGKRQRCSILRRP